MQSIVRAFVYLLHATVPVILITGFIRGSRERPAWNVFTRSTRIGFALAAGSAWLALWSWAWSALAAQGFFDFDLPLRRIYAYGIFLSLLGTLFSLIGLGRNSSIRWHATSLSLCMLVLWLVWASGE
jgi:hypothetical protein